MTYDAYKAKQKWSAPKYVSDKDLAIGSNVQALVPKYHEIPDEFKRNSNIWVKFQQDWFFNGIENAQFVMKAGIPKDDALRHLRMINRSFDLKHEHKEASVAYLASLWFEKIITDGRTYGSEI